MRAAASDAPVAVDLMPALTGIRFPLALWVVSHHLSGRGRMFDSLTSANATTHALVETAWVALTVFFAISGFVLVRRYRDTTWDRAHLTRYAVARFARVYPVYLVSLAILAPIIAAELRSGRLGGPVERVTIVANQLFLLQGWQPPVVNWNTPAWSLSCEVFFYAVFPLVVLFVRQPGWWRIGAMTAAAFAIPIAFRLLLEPPLPKPLLYFGDFLIGMAVGCAYDRVRATGAPLTRLGPWFYLPALAGGLVLLLARDMLGSFLVFDAGIRLLSALLVFGLACGGGLLSRWLSSPLMVRGGGAAYAIYILHVPVLWWFERSELRSALPPVAAGVVYMLLVVLLAGIVWREIELPSNRLLREWKAPGPGVSQKLEVGS